MTISLSFFVVLFSSVNLLDRMNILQFIHFFVIFIIFIVIRATPAVEQNKKQKLKIDAFGKKNATPVVEQIREKKFG